MKKQLFFYLTLHKTTVKMEGASLTKYKNSQYCCTGCGRETGYHKNI